MYSFRAPRCNIDKFIHLTKIASHKTSHSYCALQVGCQECTASHPAQTQRVPVKAGMQEPGMEPGTVWKGSSQEFFLLSCASIQIQAACLLHLQIPIAHCLPPAPQDTCCTSKKTSDTHACIYSTSSWTYCERPADSTMLPGQKIKEEKK